MAKKQRLVNYSFQAMGSPCHIQFYADNKKQVQQAKLATRECLERLEQRYSRYRNDSLISVINQASGLGEALSIDAEMAALLAYSEQCYQESDGLFDVTSGILRELWGVDKTDIPTEEELGKLLPLIGWDKVHWTQSSIYLPIKGMQLDFGGNC